MTASLVKNHKQGNRIALSEDKGIYPKGWNNHFHGNERPSVAKRLFEPVTEMTRGNFQVL